jgi:hypothetical protein
MAGAGRCRLHGGATRSQLRHVERELAAAALAEYGLPVTVDPGEALLQEVHRSAGHVEWLAQLVASLEHGGDGYRRDLLDAGGPAEREIYTPLSGLKQLSRDGRYEKPSTWWELYYAERRHLREVCRDAVATGVEERRVQLAERQGVILARVVRAILADLCLTEEQLALVATVVPQHLRAAADQVAPG